MTQSRKHSAIEVATGTLIGMIGSWSISYTVLHLVVDPVAIATITTALCTVWSLVRGYMVRRHFNRQLAELREQNNKPFPKYVMSTGAGFVTRIGNEDDGEPA